MNRREFMLRSSTGLLLTMGVSSRNTCLGEWKSFDFKTYREGSTLAPVTQVTPDDGFYIHTFYDVCPWSPGGRYLAVTKLPYQGRKPLWGDEADVCIIDLEARAIRKVYTTKAWSFQLGANVQWGYTTDRFLYTNDIVYGHPVCVKLDLLSGSLTYYAGSKYDLAPDEKSVVSPNLMNMNIHQYGYALPDPPGGAPVPFNRNQMDKEGLWKTDLPTNERTLLASMTDFFAAAQDKELYQNSVGYLFHSKFNKQNTRILQVFRAQVKGQGRNASLFTLSTDGSNLMQCLSAEKWNHKARLGGSGNHPNWHPDGNQIIMNCIPAWLGYRDMFFCCFDSEGDNFSILTEKYMGSGHPTVDPTSRYLLSDAYPKQTYVVSENGEIPIRLIDLKTDYEVTLCSVPTDVGGGKNQYLPEDRLSGGSQHKLDPHPAWSRDYSKVCFNGAPGGRRQVFIADIKDIVR